MANRKISQFTTTSDITTIEGLAGYNSTTNVQISGTDLLSSLASNLYSPFGNNGDVLTIVNGAPAWAVGGGGGGITTKNILWGLIVNFAVPASEQIEFVDWAGVLSPTGTHNSSLPIPFDLTIKRITLKYLDTTASSVSADFNYEVSIGKLNNPSGSSDNTNYVDLTGGANVLTLTNANVNGNHFLLEASGLSINVSAGDVLMVRGNRTAGANTGGDNEEVMVSVEYEKNYAGGGLDASELDFSNLPTTDPQIAGRLYNEGGAVMVSEP